MGKVKGAEGVALFCQHLLHMLSWTAYLYQLLYFDAFASNTELQKKFWKFSKLEVLIKCCKISELYHSNCV